jgi:hypothetical protein
VVVENSVIQVSGLNVGQYGIRVTGLDATIRSNTFDNFGRDIGVGSTAAVIVDNVIECAASIVNLGAFSYYAPVGSEPHANMPRYAPGFC